MGYNFYAFLNRMKLIQRWGLMRNTFNEDVAQHTNMTTIIAHALATIDNKIFNKDINADRVGMIAVFHEAAEIFTGDLPTPVKYKNQEIVKAYKQIEIESETKLLNTLPDVLLSEYKSLIQCDKQSYEHLLVKRADKLSAYIKCIEELSVNNKEFLSAFNTINKEIMSYNEPCVKYFIDNFIDAFKLTLDELNNSIIK